MRNIIILLLSLALVSCSTASEKKQKIGDSKKKLVPEQKSTVEISPYTNEIKGIWGDDSSENAVFDIKKDSIYYVDRFKSFKYFLKKDSIKINYSDYSYKAKIYFIKDTMVMDSHEFGVAKFWKFKN